MGGQRNANQHPG